MKEFSKMTPREFNSAMESRNKLDENKQRAEYERLRLEIMHHWNMQGKTLKTKIKDAKTVMKFPWDEEYIPGKKQTQEEIKASVMHMAKVFGKKDKKNNK